MAADCWDQKGCMWGAGYVSLYVLLHFMQADSVGTSCAAPWLHCRFGSPLLPPPLRAGQKTSWWQ